MVDTPPTFINKRKKQISRKTKVHLVFKEEDRREFLTGFRKRKQQNKQKIYDDLKQQIKHEKNRIKSEARAKIKQFTSCKRITELEEQFAVEYETNDSKVSILELNPDLLAETNFIIGRNKGKIEQIEEKSDKGSNNGKSELLGMELKLTKEMNKEIKNESSNKLQQTKAFKLKNKLEAKRQRNKARRLKLIKKKHMAKSKKIKRKKQFHKK